jgi:hypothetical protein
MLAIKVRTQVIGREDAGLLLRQFREDIFSERLEVFSIGDPEFGLTETLIFSALRATPRTRSQMPRYPSLQ